MCGAFFLDAELSQKAEISLRRALRCPRLALAVRWRLALWVWVGEGLLKALSVLALKEEEAW